MYFKAALISVCLMLTTSGFSQIKVPDVGDNWKTKVELAIDLISRVDPISHKILIDNCDQIEYIVGDRSTCKWPNVIAINTKDLELGSINNIAAVLVHESHHLHYHNQKLRLEPDLEEYLCYLREYEFLCKLSDTEDWLFKNCINQLLYYRGLICKRLGNK